MYLLNLSFNKCKQHLIIWLLPDNIIRLVDFTLTEECDRLYGSLHRADKGYSLSEYGQLGFAETQVDEGEVGLAVSVARVHFQGLTQVPLR